MADNGGARRRAGRRWLWIVAGIAAVGAVAAVVGIWHPPDRMYPPGTDGGAEARAALQGGLLTAAAALTAVAGGLIALDETRQANAEVRRANEEVRRANENTHVRELYTAAIGLLSTDTIDSRLGGIYALERIAVDSAADQRTVVEVLSAFIREHANPSASTERRLLPRRRRGQPSAGRIGDQPPRPATDVQAALTVLGRLPDRAGIPRADLGEAKLAGASLVEAKLARVDLSWSDLTEAFLGQADLSGALLHGAILTKASFYRANLTAADLGSTDLSGARLDEAILAEVFFYGADLAEVRGLTQEQLAAAHGDDTTILPAGFMRPASWVSGGPE